MVIVMEENTIVGQGDGPLNPEQLQNLVRVLRPQQHVRNVRSDGNGRQLQRDIRRDDRRINAPRV